MPRPIEAEAAVFDGHGVPAGLAQLFEDPIRDRALAELNRGAQAGQACAENGDWSSLRSSSGGHCRKRRQANTTCRSFQARPSALCSLSGFPWDLAQTASTEPFRARAGSRTRAR